MLTDRRPPPRAAPWTQSRWADIRIAAVVGLVQIVGTSVAASHQTPVRSFDVWAALLLAIGPVALVARRRAPGTVLAIAFVSTFVYDALGYGHGPIFISLIVAFFTAVMYGRRAVAWSILGLGWISFGFLDHIIGNQPRTSLGGLVALAAYLLVLGTASEIVRSRRDRSLEAWRASEEEARRRASEERVRIARELHDVLAHNISLISVQAGVALHLMDDQPEQARTALTAIKQASREALGELRSVLDVLRQADDDALPRSPTPGLDGLDQLVARAGAAGLPVETVVQGNRRSLPAGVDLASYRIVQEALTNVVRHAGAATATVRVAYGDDAVTIEVADDGRGAPANSKAVGGNGIAGMRERAAALGGTFDAGSRPDGGFRVRARLPIEGDR